MTVLGQLVQPVHAAQQGSLAAAGRANQGSDHARLNIQADAFQHLGAIVAGVQFFDLQSTRHAILQRSKIFTIQLRSYAAAMTLDQPALEQKGGNAQTHGDDE